ncbi:truncayed alpha-ketoglutarate transport protein [Escherichia coli]|nr:truncayed alpha-ketoglutarate transport protein [Escherichia coli]
MVESTVTADSKLTSSDTRRRIWAIVGPLQVIWSSGSISMSTRSVHSTLPTFSSLPGTRRLNYYKQQVFLLRDS